MSELKDVAYCGLYCRLCSTKNRTPQQAAALRKTMADDGWEDWGSFVVKDFQAFWDTLNHLAGLAESCPDCRGGCGYPGCAIRKCAVGREQDLCPTCADFPCEHIDALARRYPTLITDGRRLAEIGVAAWRAEQEQRRATGFCYCDIRVPLKSGK